MILIFLVSVLIFSITILRRFPKIDFAVALITTLILIVGAATFDESFDRENYLNTIALLQASEDMSFWEKLHIAPDPLFIGIVSLGETIGDNPAWIFGIFASIALLPKFVVTGQFPGYRSLIISAYGLFFAPTLEFAAIRAAAALGILIGLVFIRKAVRKNFGYLLALAAHISAAIPVLTMVLRNFIIKKSPVLIACIVVALVLFLSRFISNLSRAQIYDSNDGTLVSLIPPVLTVALIVFSLPKTIGVQNTNSESAYLNAYYMGLVCSSIAVAGSLIWVTIAYRFLEIGQFLLCGAACLALRSETQRFRALICIAGVLIFLAYKNTSLGTWELMLLG